MTDEERDATIKALLYEKAGYERAGKADRVKEVDKSLRALGHQAVPQEKAAVSRRPAQRAAAKRA